MISLMNNMAGDAINVNVELTAIPLAIVAILGVWFAYKTLRTQWLAARASVLLALDERVGPSLKSSRDHIRNLNILADNWLGEGINLTDEQKDRKRSEYIARIIRDEIRKHYRDIYLDLLDVCGLIETMGYTVRAQYIHLDDVYKLFGGIVLDAGVAFEAHIEDLVKETGDPETYENFPWLLVQVRRISREDALSRKVAGM